MTAIDAAGMPCGPDPAVTRSRAGCATAWCSSSRGLLTSSSGCGCHRYPTKGGLCPKLEILCEPVVELAIAGMRVTQVFSLRLAILTLAMPDFVLFGLVALVGGFVKLDLRCWDGGGGGQFSGRRAGAQSASSCVNSLRNTTLCARRSRKCTRRKPRKGMSAISEPTVSWEHTSNRQQWVAAVQQGATLEPDHLLAANDRPRPQAAIRHLRVSPRMWLRQREY